MIKNKGFTLVELIVAMAVAAIVSGSIGYFLFSSMRMYTDETVDISLQQELQTSVNTVMDSIMESQCLILDNSDEDGNGKGKTNFLVLGKFKPTGAANTYEFTGSIFASSSTVKSDPAKPSSVAGIAGGRLYMMSLKDETCNGSDINAALSANAKVTAFKTAIAADGTAKDKYIMSTNVQSFYVGLTNMCPNTDASLKMVPGIAADPKAAKGKYSFWRETRGSGGSVTYIGVYNNNITLSVSMSFASQKSSGIEYKIVNDKAMMRNHLSESIFLINNKGLDENTYPEEYVEYDKSKYISEGDLQKETVSVDSGIALGNISVTIPGNSDGTMNGPFTILEIIPNPKYSAFGYLIGGKEPLDYYAIDAAFNSEIGYYDYACQAGVAAGKSQVFGDNNKLSNFRWKCVPSSGYFEKVGSSADDLRGELGGTYAILNEDGFTDVPLITGKFVKADLNADNEKTGKYKLYGDLEESSVDFNAMYSANGYKYNGDRNKLEQCFELAGEDGGDYNFEFCKVDKNGGVYFLSEYQANPSFGGSVHNSGYSGNFSWVWHDTPEGSEFHDDSNYITVGTSHDRIYNITSDILSDLPVSSKIYVNEYDKFKVYNNEIFLLRCMGLGSSSDDHGLIVTEQWEDLILDSADGGHLQALNDYYSGDYYTNLTQNNLSNLGQITILSKTPREVIEDDVNRANLIVFANREGGIYDITKAFYDVEHLDTYTAKQSYDDGDDLVSVDILKRIYDKVINNQAAIAVGSNVFSENKKNIKNLLFILFKFTNKDIVYDENDKKVYYKEECPYPWLDANEDRYTSSSANSLFSGRVLFSDFFESNYWIQKAYSSFFKHKSDADSGVIINPGNGLYYRPTQFVKVLGNGNLYVSWWENSNEEFSNWEDAFNSTHYHFPKGDDDANSERLDFLYNKYYAKHGFRLQSIDGFVSGRSYSFANQLLFEDDSKLLTDDIPYFKSIIGTIDRTGTTPAETKKIGDFDFVGAGEKTEKAASSVRYEDAGVVFQNPASEYMSGSSVEKAIYLNAFEFDNAVRNGLDIYCLAKSEYYFSNVTTSINNTRLSNPIACTGMNDYIDASDGKHVALLKYHIPNTFFSIRNLDINGDSGVFSAQISIPNGTNTATATGKDKVKIIVRDTFDLD